MEKIISISQKRTFTLSQAHELLPIIYRITEGAFAEVKGLTNRLQAIRAVNQSLAAAIELQIEQVVEKWQSKVERLGASPKGIWLADFDNGTGYYCWKFPETEICFFHGYQDGFSGRRPISLPEEDANLRQLIGTANENSRSSNKHHTGELSGELRKDH